MIKQFNYSVGCREAPDCDEFQASCEEANLEELPFAPDYIDCLADDSLITSLQVDQLTFLEYYVKEIMSR